MVFAESRGTYGRPRLTAALRKQGLCINEKRVYRWMKEEGLQARPAPARISTTDSNHAEKVAENLLNRKFCPEAPNQVWATDIPYLPVGDGWMYLAVVMDLYSRKIIGFSVATHMKTELVEQALSQALAVRQPEPGWIHHSDRGSQYCSRAYQDRLCAAGARVSMSRRGNCWDNAVVESFFRTLKEELSPARWKTEAACREALREWIHPIYNRVRLHSFNGYQSPNDKERSWRQQAVCLAA